MLLRLDPLHLPLPALVLPEHGGQGFEGLLLEGPVRHHLLEIAGEDGHHPALAPGLVHLPDDAVMVEALLLLADGPAKGGGGVVARVGGGLEQLLLHEGAQRLLGGVGPGRDLPPLHRPEEGLPLVLGEPHGVASHRAQARHFNFTSVPAPPVAFTSPHFCHVLLRDRL